MDQCFAVDNVVMGCADLIPEGGREVSVVDLHLGPFSRYVARKTGDEGVAPLLGQPQRLAVTTWLWSEAQNRTCCMTGTSVLIASESGSGVGVEGVLGSKPPLHEDPVSESSRSPSGGGEKWGSGPEDPPGFDQVPVDMDSGSWVQEAASRGGPYPEIGSLMERHAMWDWEGT